MWKLILKRVGVGFVTALIVSVLVFMGTELLPGDVAQAVLGRSATPEALAALRETMGLNEPAYLRYFKWLFGFLTGDMGVSLANGTQINDLVVQRLGNTLILAGVTALVAIPLAVILGLMAATFPGSLLDNAISFMSLTLVSTPDFLLASILVIIFAVGLGWFPSVSYVTEFRGVGHFFQTMTLPVMTLTAVITAQMTRMVRATVLNILASPYVEMAMLKGVSRTKIIFLHALVNTIGPIANVVALNLAYLISGVVIVETVFAYPGLAKLIVDGVATRDFAVVQSCALIFCMGYIIFMLIADILAIISNPRLRRAGH
ncbi:ABC transporter permease [Roseovarius sp. 2305UL8-3]|uniref:ABC transporter permease n=1 Tax=Roseovarius conchicola TaxID=3121636 RepID=UPI00352760DB